MRIDTDICTFIDYFIYLFKPYPKIVHLLVYLFVYSRRSAFLQEETWRLAGVFIDMECPHHMISV